MRDLKERVIRGGFAKLCAQGLNFLLRMGTLMALARLIEPKDFGLVGMVTAFTGVLSLFKEFGLSSATVQRATITEEQLSTLFWINVLVGMLLTLVTVAIAPFLAAFYHEPRLFWITAIIASAFIFNAAGVQHSALLQRQMRFTSLAVIEIVALGASSAVSIITALRGYGYWAVVAWTITMPLVATVFTWLQTAWIPGRPRRQVGVRPMIRFGGTVTTNSLVVYVAYNLEKVLLGRFWGAEIIGIYGRAYQLMTLPMDNLNGAVGTVAFSALSRLQETPERLKSYFLKGYSLVLALTIPITLGCGLFADDIVLVVLGSKWIDAAPIFRLLAPTILVFALINPTWWLLASTGLVGRSLKIALVIAPLVITGYLLGLPYGAKGVALGYSTAMALWVVPHIVWCVHGTVVSVRDIWLAISRPLISGLVAGVVAFTAQSFFGTELFSAVVRLLLYGGVLATVYLGILLFAMGQKSVYLDIIRVLRKRSTAEDKVFVSA